MKKQESKYIEHLETIILKWLHAVPLTKNEEETIKKIDLEGYGLIGRMGFPFY